MKILVTGKDGQLARSLREVTADMPGLDLTWAARPLVDLYVAGSLADAIRNTRPDVVINAAAYTAVDAAETDEELAMRVNGDSAGEGALAANDVGARFVQMSTDYVFDGLLGRPYREDDAVAPINVYGRTKLAGEEQVRQAGGPHLIVRTSWVVSPFGHNFVKTMLRLARDRDEIGVVADQHGCPTSAPSLATALIQLIAKAGPDADTVHLAGSGEASWAELAEFVFACSAARGGPAAIVRPIGTADYPTPARRPVDTRLDCRKASENYGVALPDWHQSIEAIVERVLAETS